MPLILTFLKSGTAVEESAECDGVVRHLVSHSHREVLFRYWDKLAREAQPICNHFDNPVLYDAPNCAYSRQVDDNMS